MVECFCIGFLKGNGLIWFVFCGYVVKWFIECSFECILIVFGVSEMKMLGLIDFVIWGYYVGGYLVQIGKVQVFCDDVFCVGRVLVVVMGQLFGEGKFGFNFVGMVCVQVCL